MPYYVGEGSPEWDRFLESDEAGLPPRRSMFGYIQPEYARSGVLSFPREPSTHEASAEPASKPGLFARLFGRNAPPPSPTAPETQSVEDLFGLFSAEQEEIAAEALSQIARRAVDYRKRGIARLFGSYDGGNDESFGHLTRLEMANGEIIETPASSLPIELEDIEDLVAVAAHALMGRHDAGPFVLQGSLIIDFERCTLADVADPEIVLKAYE